MTDSEITTTILRQIRDQLERTNEKLDAGFDRLDQRLDTTNQRLDTATGEIVATNQRLDLTNQRLDVTNERLSLVETGVREVRDELSDLNRYVRNTQAAAILDLRERVTKLEKKVG